MCLVRRGGPPARPGGSIRRRDLVRFVLMAAMALAAAACRADDPGRTGPAVQGGSSVTPAAHDSIHVELLLEPRARAGEPVRLRLRAANVTRQAVDLYLRGRVPTFDVIVRQRDGVVVWRRLEGEIIPAIVQLRALRPGERLELEASWAQRTNGGDAVAPGDYVVEACLLTDGEPLCAPPSSLVISRFR